MSQFNTRVQLKTDIAENWAKATNFSPLKGEIIVYSDLNKIKIGDGNTNVNNLPFVSNYELADYDIDGLMSAEAFAAIDNSFDFTNSPPTFNPPSTQIFFDTNANDETIMNYKAFYGRNFDSIGNFNITYIDNNGEHQEETIYILKPQSENGGGNVAS